MIQRGRCALARFKHCGFTFLALFASCAPVDRAGAITEAPNQSQTPTPVGEPVNPWAGRSGEAEALADLAKGLPIKLYYQWIAGERQVIRTPGLRNCNPERFDVPGNARSKFVAIGADFSESIQYTDEERARFRSASRFARAYNLTIFSKRTEEVVQICPAVTRE